MATSGVHTFTLTVQELITLAMLEIGALAIGESPTNDETADAMKRINLMLSSLQNLGVFLYKVDTNTVDTVSGTDTYSLASGTKRLLHAYITNDNTDTVLNKITQAEYDGIYTKDATGVPTDYTNNFNTQIPTITLYPVPDKAYTVTYRSNELFESVTGTGQTLDIPQNGLLMLTKGLAYSLANSYRVSMDERQLLYQEYEGARKSYISQDTETHYTDIVTPRGVLIT